MIFNVVVDCQLRDGISDPAGATIERALPTLGFDGVSSVHVGKSIRFTIDAASERDANATVQKMCDRFLTNPVIESADVTVTASAAS